MKPTKPTRDLAVNAPSLDVDADAPGVQAGATTRPCGFSLPGIAPARPTAPAGYKSRSDIESLEPRQLFSTVGVDDSNQYFTDTDGDAVFLTGYYAWGAVTDGYYIDHPRSYKGYRDLGQQYDLNYIRISLGVNRFSNTTSPASVIPAGDYYRGATPIPFETDGSGRVNLDRFDQRFWDGLAAQVAGASAQGQIAHVALFDGVDIRTSFSNNDRAFRWPNSFWNPANHQRDFYGYGELGWNVDLDGSGDGNADQDGDFYRTGDFNGNYGVGRYQRALIDKTLQTLAPYQNVILEVGNELSASADWNNAVINYIDNEQNRYGTRFAVTANPLGGGLDTLYYKAGFRADGVAYHEADTALEVKRHLAQIDNFANLPVWEDPDGPALNRASSQELRQAAWFSLTGGAAGWGGYTETSANPDHNTLRYYQNLQRFLDQADLDLSDFRPAHNLITNGNSSNSVLADRGDAYVAYVLWDGQVGMDLSAIEGDARVRFYNPESGQWVGEQTVSNPGYETFYRPGGTSDWVILVEEVARAQQPTYTPPPPAPAPQPAPAPAPAPTRAPAPAPTPSGNSLWFEGFDLGSGATNDYGSTEWTTNGFTAGLHAVRDGAFVANNTDNEVIFRTEVIDLGPINNHARVALDLRSDGGLDSGQDYFSVNVIVDGGAEQNIAYYDGTANNNNTVNIRSGEIWGSRLQVVIRQKNTSTGETYTFDNLRVERAGSAPASPPPAAPSSPAPSGNGGGGSNNGSRFWADFNEADGIQWTAGNNGWWIERGTNGTFAVENGAFTATNTYGEGVWKSASISTAGLRNAALSVDVTSSGGFDGNSYLRLGYIVDGREVTFFDGTNTINGNRARVVTADLPEGTTLQLVVRTNASGGTYRIDNLRVGEGSGNAAPVPSTPAPSGGGSGGGFTIFNETFDGLANGTRLASGDTGWWVERWPNGVFQVENSRFEIRGTYGLGLLKTQLIDLRGSDAATISFDLDSSGSFSQPGSFLNVFVEVDGQRRTLYSGSNGINNNNGDRISVSGIRGDFAQIIIEGSATNGTLTIDNLRVDSGSGSNNDQPANAPAQQQNSGSNNGTEFVRFENSIESYSWLDGEGGDAAPTPQVRNSGSTATLRGNSWKKMQLPRTMTIGYDTVLEFDARTSSWPQVEIAGLGFDNNDDPYDGERIVQIAGTQSAGRLASDARGTGIGFGDAGWSYYRVRLADVLDDFSPFQATHLILVSDHDAPGGSNLSNYATTDFANVRITNAG